MNALTINLSVTDRQLGCINLALAAKNSALTAAGMPNLQLSDIITQLALQRVLSVENQFGVTWDLNNPVAAQINALNAALANSSSATVAAQQAAAVVAGNSTGQTAAAAALISSSLTQIVIGGASTIQSIAQGTAIQAPAVPVAYQYP